MKRIALALLLLSLALSGAAAGQSCKDQATERKLAGAALNSFTKKCETDAATACDKAAADKKLWCCQDQLHDQMRQGCLWHLGGSTKAIGRRAGNSAATSLSRPMPGTV